MKDHQLTTLGLILDDFRVDDSVPMLGDGDAGETEVEKSTYTASGQLEELPCG